MAFDIHQQIFNEDGQPLEQEAEEYQDTLLELFEQSSEAQELWNEGFRGTWPPIMLELGRDHLGVTPPQMSDNDLREILFELIPRKITALAEQAPEVVRELQAFWQFMQREFHLANATACLSLLNDKAIDTLKKEMSNPANFGMAKSFLMMGLERGFNMRSQEGIDAWMKTYNAELAAGKITPPVMLPGLRRQGREDLASRIHILGAPDDDSRDDSQELASYIPTLRTSGQSFRHSSYNKQKARMAKASRKKNRKRK